MEMAKVRDYRLEDLIRAKDAFEGVSTFSGSILSYSYSTPSLGGGYLGGGAPLSPSTQAMAQARGTSAGASSTYRPDPYSYTYPSGAEEQSNTAFATNTYTIDGDTGDHTGDYTGDDTGNYTGDGHGNGIEKDQEGEGEH